MLEGQGPRLASANSLHRQNRPSYEESPESCLPQFAQQPFPELAEWVLTCVTMLSVHSAKPRYSKN